MVNTVPEQLPQDLSNLLGAKDRLVCFKKGGDLVSVELGDLRMELEHMGEGYNGDYDEDDPDDVPLLRFAFMSRRLDAPLGEDDGEEWEELELGSYCIEVDAREPWDLRAALALKIFTPIQAHLETELGDELLGDVQGVWAGLSRRMIEEVSLVKRDDLGRVLALLESYRLDQQTASAASEARPSPRL